MNNPVPCKGFWNMCPCVACRAREHRLESELESAKPKERQELLAASIQELKTARGIH